MKRSGQRGRSGFTMLEVVIASSILAVLMFMSYSILHSSTSTATRGEMTASLESRGKHLTEALKGTFYDAHFSDLANYSGGVNNPPTTFAGLAGIHDGNTQVHFQVALRQNVTGAMLYGFVGTSVNNDLNLSNWAGYSCVIRFEPEIVMYEGAIATPLIPQPREEDVSAPQTFKPNPYLNPPRALTPTTELLPTRVLNKDLNGDGLKSKVYVLGKIWKYTMLPYTVGTAPQVLATERLADNVVLAVAADLTYTDDVDVASPVGQPRGKDALFRFLRSEPAPPTRYGNTDLSIFGSVPVQNFPTANSVAIAFTVWHCVPDDQGKLYFFRKSWDKVPFRLSTGN